LSWGHRAAGTKPCSSFGRRARRSWDRPSCRQDRSSGSCPALEQAAASGLGLGRIVTVVRGSASSARFPCRAALPPRSRRTEQRRRRRSSNRATWNALLAVDEATSAELLLAVGIAAVN